MAYCIAIETSCDETSLAVLEFDSKELKSDHDFHKRINSIQLLVSLVSSQIEVHKLYGGVVPEIGAREHSKLIYPLFTELVRQFEEKTERSKTDLYKDLQMVAVTTRPGLDSALRVGEECAKSLQFFIAQKSGNTDIQIQRVNHLHGHVMSSFYATPFESKLELVSDKELFPHLHVLVSGGEYPVF
jgi:N6-L-threonylcarbamoyladenine synthase